MFVFFFGTAFKKVLLLFRPKKVQGHGPIAGDWWWLYPFVAARQLLSPDLTARLNGGVEGGVGVKKLMKHPFFAGIDWGVRTRDVASHHHRHHRHHRHRHHHQLLLRPLHN